MALVRKGGLLPLLAAVYPVLDMLAANAGQVRPSIGARPVILALLGAGLLALILRWLIHDWARAVLLTTLLIMLFFAYGHAYNTLKSVDVGGFTLGRHRYLVPCWLLLGVLGSLAVLRRPPPSGSTVGILSLGMLIAVLIPLWRILWYQIESRRLADALTDSTAPVAELVAHPPPPQELPDIYYLVLDAYARSDTLLQSFDHDNSEFIEALQDLGFYVVQCSQSNYAQTELSLASALNLEYLENLVDDPLREAKDRERLWPLIRQSVVRRTLEQMGYTSVAFETGYYWTEWEDADLYLRPESGLLAGMSSFEATLLRSTAAWAAIDFAPILPRALLRDLDRSADAHRERVRFVLAELARMPERPAPKFVFVHLVSPHRPFVYDAEGGPVDDDYNWTNQSIGLEEYREGYRQQLTFLNRQLVPIVERILANSEPTPVILIQSDHGPEEGSSQDRMRNFSAYRLDAAQQDELYPQMTPVNSFRSIFNILFAAGMDRLEDVSYFSSYDRPFDYVVVPNECAP